MKINLPLFSILFFLTSLICQNNEVYASKRYVTPIGSGNYSGSSWGNASNDLQAMINNSSSGDEVWVKYGTYIPISYPTGCTNCSSSRDYTFTMKSGVSVYGQFAGTETSITQRVLGQGQSILSGDILNDGLISNNAYHVVSFIKCYPAAFLDGFTIKNGNANVNSSISVNTVTSPVVYNRDWGGGILFYSDNDIISNCHIIENTATSGGGMLATNYSRPNISNSIFVNNTAGGGAAIYNHDNSYPLFNYVTITNNNATVAGGAMYNYNGSHPTIINTIIWNNTCPANAAYTGIVNNGATPDVSYSIVQNGNSPCTSCPNTNGNINPLFVNSSDPNGADNIWGSSDDGLELRLDSPAMEKAFGTVVPGTDITGQIRHFDSPFRYSHPTVYADLGAYENHSTTPIIQFVNGSLTTGLNNGTSWANAFRGSNALTIAITTASEGNDIWVASGVYKPSSYPTGCVGCSSNRDFTFHLKDGVKMYGGFAGIEIATNQRNLNTAETILSGDINTIGDSTDNVAHVVLTYNDRELTAMDGFTIKDGGYNVSSSTSSITVEGAGQAIKAIEGGGMNAYGSKITLTNINFIKNIAVSGGALSHYNSYFSRLMNCKFSKNSAYNNGGALNLSSDVDIEFNNCIFNNNSANQGGAIYNLTSDFKLYNSIISENLSPTIGGGNSAIYDGVSSASIMNCTIFGNKTTNVSGAIMTLSNTTKITNSIIWGNTTGIVGDIIYDGDHPIVSNSIIQGGYTPCTSCPNTNGNIDPKFALHNDADGLDNKWLTFDDGLAIIASSPAYNAGTNIGAQPLDIKGNPSQGANKDIGAYAFRPLDFCDQNQLIAEKPLPNGNYMASNLMISTAIIPNANNVLLEAAHQVLLLPGFTAENGAVFKAQIGPDCILGEI